MKRQPAFWIYVDAPADIKPMGLTNIQLVPGKKPDDYSYKVLEGEKIPVDEIPSHVDKTYNIPNACPPHSFKCCIELKTLYCKKCGKTKPI
jgi:hypothetical protein